MILYNVTLSIDEACEVEWLKWMKEIHIPEVIKTGFFRDCKLCRLIGSEEQGGKTYAIMYTAHNERGLTEYKSKHSAKLQNEHNLKFQGKFVAFRTELNVLEEYRYEG